MVWSVQTKVSRAIKADGRTTVARKCMLTQCADYDHVWLDVKSMLWLWWCKVYIKDGRRRGEWCRLDTGLRRAWVLSKAQWCALYCRTRLGSVPLPWWSRVNWPCNCILYYMCSTQTRRNKHDVFLEERWLLNEPGGWNWKPALRRPPCRVGVTMASRVDVSFQDDNSGGNYYYWKYIH